MDMHSVVMEVSKEAMEKSTRESTREATEEITEEAIVENMKYLPWCSMGPLTHFSSCK